MRVLWLASWYPDEYQKENGDFVQRHAEAAATLLPIDVIHVVQAGSNVNTNKYETINKTATLREFIYSFKYRKTGITFIDKFRYNIKYQLFYMRLLDNYIREYGIPELIHIHAPMKSGIIGRKAAKFWKIPYIVSEHSSMYDIRANDTYAKRSIYFRKQVKKVLRDADAIINVSWAMNQKIASLFSVKKLLVIRNVVDTALFNYYPNNENEKFKWLHVSSLYPLKNVEKIIEAFSKIPPEIVNWELQIIGEQYQSIHTLVYQKALSHKVIFLGKLPHSEVATYMQQSSAFIMFSKHENFPCVVVEALCCGLPIVASDVGGIKEAVNISNGILVENENVEQLKDAIITCMNNYQLYNRGSIAANAKKLYSIPTIANEFVTAYRKIIS